MKKQRRGLNRYNVLRDRWRPWSAKQHHCKSEAKEDYQLSPGGPSKIRKSSGLNQLKLIALGWGAFIESKYARSTGVQ